MIFKLFVVAALFGIIASLASAMFCLVKDKGRSNRTVKALSWRIGLSLALFFLLFVGWAAGLIRPHGLYPQNYAPREAPAAPAPRP